MHQCAIQWQGGDTEIVSVTLVGVAAADTSRWEVEGTSRKNLERQISVSLRLGTEADPSSRLRELILMDQDFNDDDECKLGYNSATADELELTLFVWLVSQPASSTFLSHQISISHQPAVLFSNNKSAPGTSHNQPNRAIWHIKKFAQIFWSHRTA